MAVSLDIVKAFGTLPWPAIWEVFVYNEVPHYLRSVIEAYLQERWVDYDDQNRTEKRKEVQERSYDQALRTVVPRDVSDVCYADDTLVVATGPDLKRTLMSAQLEVAIIVRRIPGLGLEIASHKCEALWIHRLTRGWKPRASTWVSTWVTRLSRWEGT